MEVKARRQEAMTRRMVLLEKTQSMQAVANSAGALAILAAEVVVVAQGSKPGERVGTDRVRVTPTVAILARRCSLAALVAVADPALMIRVAEAGAATVAAAM